VGKFSRDKGNRVERLIVDILKRSGFHDAQRVPLSGAALGAFAGDVSLSVCEENWRGEVKCRATGFATLYGWLEPVRFLVLKADNKDPLIVMRLSDAARIGALAQKARG
jgi:Holliday junction resolvase